MGVRIPVGFGQVSMAFTLSGDPEPMVMTFGIDAPPSPDPSAIADEIHTVATRTGGPFQPSTVANAYTIGPFTVACQLEPGLLTSPGVASVLGTNASQLNLPQNCALLVKKGTGQGGRLNRGRFYQPPFNFLESAVDQRGEITAAQVLTLQNSYNQFLADLDAANYGMYVLHSGFGAPTRVTQLTVQRTIATQRRRLRR